MSPYLPDARSLAAVALSWSLVPVLVQAGGVCGRRAAPEVRFVAGWGLLCLILTAWGVATSASLAIPAAAFVVTALAGFAVPSWRPEAGQWRALGRMAVLSLPLWVVLAPIRPSQPDTFLNLLPNAAYLVDHRMFPALTRPESYSFLPVAPYNTQFASFLGGLVLPGFPAAGMSFFNLLLQLAAGMVFARCLEGRQDDEDAGKAPSWGAMAGGLLLAIPLNPGFVPRIFLTAYGEPALAVTAAFAAFLMLTRTGLMLTRAGGTLALGLVLAAMVNAKQSGIGLVAALAVAALALALVERARPLAARLRYLAAALLPALLLYGAWRWYVLSRFPGGELTPLPWSQWQWALLGQILASMAGDMGQKGVYFGLAGLTLPLLILTLWRRGWSLGARALFFHAVLFVAYDAFLITTYIGHFQGKDGASAHSYFRYSMHLSLVMVLAYILALREAAWPRRLLSARPRVFGAVAVILILALPVAFAQRLRFDLALPQPLVWELAKRTVPYLGRNSRLALVLPGDNGSVATMLAGVLRDTAPRRPDLDLTVRETADTETLAEIEASGYDLALVSCTTPLINAGLPGMPADAAALLQERHGVWRIIALWPWSQRNDTRRWQSILAAAPLCRTNATESLDN